MQDWLPLVRRFLGIMLAISLPPAILYWFIIHPFIGFWRRMGLTVTYVFLTVFYVGSMVGLYLVRDTLLGRDLGTSVPLIVVAVPLMVVASVISRKRRKYLTFRRLAGVPEVAPEKHGIGLLREGIYGRMRHPRYVEFTLALVAWSLVCNYVGLYWMTAATIVLLYIIVILEEHELRERYGQEYVDYSAQVPRFFPRQPRRQV
jgi:protein-S-isoprenylcysteine O-methyltransferase Ste14